MSGADSTAVRTRCEAGVVRWWMTAVSARCGDYSQMARPRIIVMSAAAISAGFLLASPEFVNWRLMLSAVIGSSCLVAASSILNQVIESDSDRRMKRTASRPVASGRLARAEAAAFGILLSALGTGLLLLLVNSLTALTALLTMLTYVVIYTPLKRRTSLCTTIGAIPGAMPPVLGWFAAGGNAGIEPLALFAVFFVWQFPHFLAIGWIYQDDYHAAGLRMLPSFSDGGVRTAWIAFVYAVAFVPVSCLPRFVGLAGPGYLAAALVLSIGYLVLTIRFVSDRSRLRARQLMTGSLICLPVLLICLVADFFRSVS